MKPIPILAVDFLETLRVLRSVAAAKEVAQSTKYGWRTTDLFALANLSGEVGMWEAEVPNGRQLKAAIQASTRDRALTMIRVAGEGPVPLVQWLAGQVRVRDQFLNNYREQVAGFNQINRSTLNALDASVRFAKTGRFAANVGLITGSVALALYGVGVTISGSVVAAGSWGAGATVSTGTAIGVPLVGLTKSIAFGIIKEWNNAQYAKVASVVFESGKAGLNEGLGRKGGAIEQSGIMLAATASTAEEELSIVREAQRRAAEQAERRVLEAEAKLARMEKLRIGGQSVKGAKERTTRIATQRATVELERQAMKQATAKVAATSQQIAEREAIRLARAQWLRMWGTRLVKGSTAAFALWDSYDALAELGE